MRSGFLVAGVEDWGMAWRYSWGGPEAAAANCS